MSTAVDFSAILIDPAAIKAAGHSAVLVYVSPSRPGSNFGAKPVTTIYTAALQALGLNVVSIWQYGKPNGTAPSDWTTGYNGGHQMALQAAATHTAAGGPNGAPIFFAVDENISLTNWNSTAVQFFRGACDAIGKSRVGVYGSSAVCAWAIEDDVIGTSSEGKRWAWQTKAWSNGLDTPEAVLYQRVVDTASSPGPKIAGSAVDVNDILAGDYGQWALHDANTPPSQGNTVTQPAYTELDRMGDSCQSRNGARITNFLLHTEEGNSTAESLAAYLNNPNNSASYHYTVRDGIVCDVVDTDLASWSVLDANAYTINLCFAGSRAAWSRDQWMAIDGDLRIAAWLAVQDAKKYGFSTNVIAPPYHRADGVSDHKYVTDCLGIGTHTDVGANFPWDVFAQHVAEYTGAAPAPTPTVVNAIDAKAAESPWLGDRITQGENTCPDGVGKWAQFTNGYIYWSPSTGAHPIPASLFGKFADLGWEAGPLGYPTTDHTVLNGSDGKPVGDVQGYQGGALYVRYGQPACWVHGAIRDRWNKSGFETGPFGWPTSDEQPHDDGTVQTFDHGSIYWSPSSTVGILANS
jgi:hypothetical protein